MKRLITSILLLITISPNAPADDTDIYIGGGAASGGTPLVMLTVDFRQNLSGYGCGGGKCDTLVADGHMTAAEAADSNTSQFDVLRVILKKVLGNLSGVKIGFMMPHNRDNNCTVPSTGNAAAPASCSNGGFIPVGFFELGTTTQQQADLAAFHATLALLPVPTNNNTAHPTQLSETFFEFFRYLTGQTVVNAYNSGNDTAGGVTSDTSIETSGVYTSPLANINCGKVYTISFTDGKIGFDKDSNDLIDDALSAGGLDLSLPNNADTAFELVLTRLNGLDLADGTFGNAGNLTGSQTVTSYFFASTSGSNSADGWAQAGGTGTSFDLAADPDDLAKTLEGVFAQILSTSTTFVAPSVPVNVFNRAQTLNEVFIAIFEANAAPRWVGNVKKLKLVTNASTGISQLEDRNGDNAIGLDGRINPGALTFWTVASDLPDPLISSPAESDDDSFLADRDGKTVDRGGAGSRLPGFFPTDRVNPPGTNTAPGTTNPAGKTTKTSARKLFLEPDSYSNGTATTLRNLHSDNTTATELLTLFDANNDDSLFEALQECSPCDYNSATTAVKDAAEAELALLLKFARGIDTEDEDGDGETDDSRPWSMADPLHSRPLPINFGDSDGAGGTYSEANPDIRILMGANDGYLHMFRANDGDGVESWAFMPRDMLPELIRLRDNSVGTPLHPYLVDGAAVAYVDDANNDSSITSGDGSGDKAYVYFGLRRGGKAYYALDITDPDNPKMLWSIDKGDSDFAQMGQTWSIPRVGNMLIDIGSGAEDIPVLIFGGGYNGDDDGDDDGDQGKDERDESDSFVGDDDDEGNAIFIVDARNGDLIWKAVQTGAASSTQYVHSGLKDSIPSAVTAVDTNGNQFIDRLYVGDTGGVVWRADINTPDRSLWTLTRFASVGRHAESNNENDRRFFHRPDFVQSKDSNGVKFDAIVIGTGDRPYPLGDDVKNWFYMFKDEDIVSGTPPATTLEHDDLVDLTSNCLQTDTKVNCLTSGEQLNFNNGWRIQLEQCIDGSTGDCGEKTLARPLTLKGTIFFTTYLPPDDNVNSCAPSEGSGLIYGLSLQNATATQDFNPNASGLERFEDLTSAGLPSELVPLSGGDLLRADLTVQQVEGGSGWKTFWYNLFN